jgi:hypothetical protein
MPSGRVVVRRVVFWSLLALIAVYLDLSIGASRGLTHDVERIQQRGEPIDVDAWRTSPTTDEQRRAAELYAAAVERSQETGREEGFRFSMIDVDRVPPAAGLDDLAATYRNDAPALQLLDQATPLDFGGFGTIAPDFYSNSSAVASLGTLNALRADLLARRGEGDAAARALIGSVRLHRAIQSSFSSYVLRTRLLASLRILLRHSAPGEPSLAALQRAFEEWPDEDGMTGEIMRERANFLASLDAPRRGVGERVAFAVLRPAVNRFARRQLALFDESLAVSRQPWPDRIDAAAALRHRYLAPEQMKSRDWLDAAVNIGRSGLAVVAAYPDRTGLNLAIRRVAVTTLALERYRRAHGGAAPDSLTALVPAFMPAVPIDPFSGKPIVYKKEAASYLLYSVDTNRVDDGGALYGIAARTQLAPRLNAPRDAGLRVPFAPER